MVQQLKATYSNGVFKPAMPIDLDDGAQVVIEVSEESHARNEFLGLEASAGGWKDIVDCEQLINDGIAISLVSVAELYHSVFRSRDPQRAELNLL